MPILALDTATMVSSVALADEKKIMAELTLQTKLTHSETLMPHVQQIMEMADVKREYLEAIAVSIGPGSFTGLRIGLAAAKTLAYAFNIPLIGVSTMEALAWHYPVPNVNIVPLIDAQKGNVYSAVYRWSNEKEAMEEIEEVAVYGFDEIIEKLGNSNETCILLGDMAVKKALPKKAKGELPANVMVAPIHTIMPRAATVAVAGLKKLANNEIGSVMDMEPIYIRRSEAEDLWEKRQAKLKAEAEKNA